MVWLFTAPGRASWLQSQLAAAWARSPASLGPRSRCLRFSPTVARLFFPLPLLLWWQICFFFFFLVSFSPLFSFSSFNGRSQGRGRLGEL